MKINQRLTKINYNKSKNRTISHIVIHYVGDVGGAEANCKYFEKVYRAASAHYFVGHQGEIWQCVEDKNIAWHCGAKGNANSIGIEMCCRKGANNKWYFEAATVASTIGLVRELMAKYNIPVENVIRHYDVTGKKCPEPYVRNVTEWKKFKLQLTTTKVEQQKSNEEIAQEVLNGKWGNGTERKKRLAAAGFDYDTIQSIVNKKSKKTVNKSVETVAKEVLNGKWGNGEARKKALAAAGYVYSEVQAMVNKLWKKN